MGRKDRRRRHGPAKKAALTGGGLDPGAALTAALAHHQAGRIAQAERIYGQILAAQPNNADVLHLLGLIALHAGRSDDAVGLIERAIALKPDNAEAFYNLGLAEQQRGQLDNALLAFEKAVTIKPDFVSAANNLGNVLREMGRFDHAAEAYRRAAELEPERADIHCNCGYVQMKLGEYENALRSLEKALELNPRLVDAHFTLGKLYATSSKLEAAVDSFRQAIAYEPEYIDAHMDLGTMLMELGRVDDGRDCYRRVHKIEPGHAQTWFLLAKIKSFSADDPEIETMEGLLHCLPIDDEGRIYLGFALAKAWDDIGDTDKAFSYLEAANRLKRNTFQYDADEPARLVERIIKAFDVGVIPEAPHEDLSTDSPIFILGMPRSGTTLVEQILASHSQIFGAGEREDLTRLAEARDYPEEVVGLPTPALKELGESYVGSLQSLAPQSQRVTDKTPGNFLYIGLIRLCLPNAKVVHCVRDPMDTCLSCYKELFASGQSYSYDLEELGGYYRTYHRVMEHWKGLFPGFINDLIYEDLIADPETEIRKLLSFVELPWEDGCLEFHKTERPVRTASVHQVRQPIYETSVRRWKKYQKQLSTLADALGPLGISYAPENPF